MNDDFDILDPFARFEIPLDDWVETGLDWLVANFRPFFQAIRWPIDGVLDAVEGGLLAVPPLAMAFLLGLIGWQAASARLGAFAAATVAALSLVGVYDESMTTLALVLTAVLFCILIGVPLGILSARSDRTARILRPLLDAMQTTPAFVYLVPIVMLLGIGDVPGVVVTIIFAVAPLIRLTDLGIRQVPADVIEASHAFGASSWQMLIRVQLPLAARTIMAGVNQTLMLALSMVVIASMISVGGLGQMVLRGIGRLDMGLAAVGGLGIVLLAILLDRLTQAAASGDRAVKRWTERGPVGLLLNFLHRPDAGDDHATPDGKRTAS